MKSQIPFWWHALKLCPFLKNAAGRHYKPFIRGVTTLEKFPPSINQEESRFAHGNKYSVIGFDEKSLFTSLHFGILTNFSATFECQQNKITFTSVQLALFKNKITQPVKTNRSPRNDVQRSKKRRHRRQCGCGRCQCLWRRPRRFSRRKPYGGPRNLRGSKSLLMWNEYEKLWFAAWKCLASWFEHMESVTILGNIRKWRILEMALWKISNFVISTFVVTRFDPFE